MMGAEDKRARRGQMLLLAVYLVFVAVILATLFYGLGNKEIVPTDEAWHGANAYEMLAHGNPIVNTHYYQLDYFNCKPPFGLWCMMLAYRVFGYSIFAMRFASSAAGALTFAAVSVFLWKRYDALTAAAFAAAFPLMTALFEFHMYRTGDLDAVFGLWFTVAMLALYETRRRPRYILLYGFSLGAAFMTKSVHAAVIFAIGVLYLPAIRKKLTWRLVCGAILLSVSLTAAWAVLRYQYDGTEFLYQMLFGESSEQISAQFGWRQFTAIARVKVWQAMCIAWCAELLIGWGYARRRPTKARLLGRLRENGLFLLWAFVPPVMFALAGSEDEWYVYPAYFAAAILTAISVRNSVRLLAEGASAEGKRTGRALCVLFLTAFFAVCLTVSVRQLQRVSREGKGGNPAVQFGAALSELAAQHGRDTYAGRNAYIENDDYKMKAQGEWEIDYGCYAEILCDFVCRDGGVEAFLEDPDGVLCLDEDLWEDWRDTLTGYVILEDNTYLVFLNERY